jgi:hypothetical protein
VEQKVCPCGDITAEPNWYAAVWFTSGGYRAKLCYSPDSGRGKLCYKCAKKDGEERAAAKNAKEGRH